MSERPTMSRAVRTARGSFGALTATLLAAASHALAGGAMTPIAVVATAVLALPLCVLLAGRAGSLWRLSLAVVSSQFVYHWSFAGLGTAPGGAQLPGSAGAAAGALVSPHDHLGALAAFAPSLASSSAAAIDLPMWISHAVAAVLTIALMHRGEAAALHLAHVLRRTVAIVPPAAVRLPVRPAILAAYEPPAQRGTQILFSAISHRGPPAPSFAR